MPMFEGICPALVTPLMGDGKVNVEATEKLIQDLIATGIGGLYVCGGTGEGIALSPEVRRKMAEVAIGAASGRVPVMIHVGAIDTKTILDLAKHANQAGADAISALPPFYFRYPFEAVREHYRTIASASRVPVYVYHIPSATGTSLTIEQLLEVCALEGIAGLKYSAGNMSYLSKLLAMRDPDEVNVLSGADGLNMVCMSLGVDAAIGSFYNMLPRLFIDIGQSVLRGELATARRLQFAANEVMGVTRPFGGIPSIKAMLTMQGYDVGFGVPPMPPIKGDDAKRLQRDLDEAGLGDLLRRRALYGPPGDPLRGRLG